GEGQQVAIVFEPSVQEQGKGVRSRRVELRFTRNNLSSEALKKILEEHGKKLDRPISSKVTWDVQERIILQQVLMLKGRIFIEWKNVAFRLNDTALNISPRVFERFGAKK